MSRRDHVLLTWLARNNDPYERDRSGSYRTGNDGERIPGPTLNLLFDAESPYRDRVSEVVVFVRGDAISLERVEETREEVADRDESIRFTTLAWDGDDPTDHASVFRFVQAQLPTIRAMHPVKQLLIHTSPGTPTMHTIWVLMATTGFVAEPFTLVKSYRKAERRGRPPVVPIEFDVDTFYKRYQTTRPREVASTDQALHWDPGKFRSDGLKRLFEEARSIAPLRAPVLLLGERGTGKTTLANWIRLNSPFRRDDLNSGWPAVACGQYRPETMASALFGHKKGAFTGATADHPGLLLQANGDTLFLDEVGDLSRDTQRLLIKAIEEERFQPMGETDWKPSTFRLITATNVPLDELRRRLDPDFFDRISLLRVHVPPLREIREDISWLWHDVLAQVEARADAHVTWPAHLTDCVLRFLGGHPLPGNLRDLQAIAWRALARWRAALPGEDQLAAWLPTALDSPTSAATGNLARDVAGRFASGLPLDDLLPPGAELPTREIQRELQRWIAQEVRRVALGRGVAPGTLTDVTAKTLRERLM